MKSSDISLRRTGTYMSLIIILMYWQQERVIGSVVVQLTCEKLKEYIRWGVLFLYLIHSHKA